MIATFKLVQNTATQMIAHHSIKFILIKNPFKYLTFEKLRAMALIVYAVGVTKIVNDF